MTIDDKFRHEKLKHDLNGEIAKILALSSGKTDKYEYLPSEEILSFIWSKTIKQAKFTNFPLEKVLEKQRKAVEDEVKTNICYYEWKRKTTGFN